MPIPKISDPKHPSDYRPISLLPLISKLLERVAYDQVNRHIEPLMTQHQCGFRRNFNTEVNLVHISNQINKNLDEKNSTILILLDMSKAFDSVCHTILTEKLNRLGLDETSQAWFKSYLADRSQVVKLGKSTT